MSELTNMADDREAKVSHHLRDLEDKAEARRQFEANQRPAFKIDLLDEVAQDGAPTAQWLVHEQKKEGSFSRERQTGRTPAKIVKCNSAAFYGPA